LTVARPDGSRRPPSDEYVRLKRLWEAHRKDAFPAAGTADARLQEVALYESWLGSIVEAALARGGRLLAAHAGMLEARRAESSPALWSAAAELGEPVRSYVARLMTIEDLLTTLPSDR
jgi:hypothetical protein